MIKVKAVANINPMPILLLSCLLIASYYRVGHQTFVQSATTQTIFAETSQVVKSLAAVKTLPIAREAAKPVSVAASPIPQVIKPLPILPPVVTFKVLPLYPSSALAKELSGTVVLSVYVGLLGQPEKIETKVSSGVVELDQSATAAVRQWRFSPATQGGTALASCFEVPVRFEVK